MKTPTTPLLSRRRRRQIFGRTETEERIISYLPLSHVAGMMVDIVCPLVAAAEMKGWACLFFARNYDLRGEDDDDDDNNDG
jgi:long-subunit acyl-CoA synthetase (AMP-forming)